MVEPTGYTALDLIGFTDKGSYDPLANYVRNDLVHVGNSTWRCKIDDTTGITPTEGANWTIFIESATSLAGMSDVELNTPKAGDGLVHDGNDWTNIPIMTKEQWKKNGAYNHAPNDLISQVEAGITYQTLSDKTIQASGTASGSSSIWITKNIKLKKGTYKICGTPSGGHYNNGYALYVTIGNTAIATDTENTLGLSDIFTVTNEATLYNLAVVIRSGVTAPSAPFKPMITTDLNATYDDYVPYAKTNRELTNLPNNLGASVDLTGYTSENNMYEFPSDGYIRYAIRGNQSGTVAVYGNNEDTTGSAYLMFGASSAINATTTTVLRGSVYVRKGMKAYCSGTVASADFIPLK